MANIAFWPYSGENAFAQLWAEAAHDAGYSVCDLGKMDYKASALQGIDAAVLSWFDEISTKNPLKSYWASCQKRNMFDRLQSSDIKAALTIHNIVPHENLSPRQFLSLRKYLLERTDAIVILCDATRDRLRSQLGEACFSSIEDKIMKVPHPSYSGVYLAGGASHVSP